LFRGENLQGTIDSTQYPGIRWLRAGIEGNVPIEHFIQLHQQAWLRFSWGLGSGGTSLAKLIETGRQIAQAISAAAFCKPGTVSGFGFRPSLKKLCMERFVAERVQTP